MKALINFIFFLFYIVPQWIVFNTGCLIGVLFRCISFRRKVIEDNLKVVFPEMAQLERKSLLKKIYRHFGLLVTEIIRQAYFKKLRTCEKIKSDGLQNVDDALKLGKGVCILTGHIGNWELAGAVLAERGYDNQIVVKKMKDSAGAGNHILYCIRDKNGVRTIPRENAVKDVIRALKAGKMITFVLDQNMTSSEGIFVDFFGKKACTMTSLATIVRKTGSPVIPGTVYRNADGKSHTLWAGKEIEWIAADDSKEEITLNTRRYNQVLEEMILSHPEQWIWMHKRWKTRPPEMSQNN